MDLDELKEETAKGKRVILNKKEREALREAGFTTVEYLAYATKRELKQVGLGPKTVEKTWLAAVKTVFPKPFITAAEYHQKYPPETFTTGSRALDNLLGGGVETRCITEIGGSDSVGKTQLCHQLAVNVQLPRENGGLEGGVLFYDTEGTFRTRRIIQIAEAKRLDPQKVLAGITVATCLTSDQQEDFLRNGAAEVVEKNIRLIIVDSLIAQYRSEYIGRDLLATRQQYLNRYMHRLSRISHAFNLAVVVTNQAISSPTLFGAKMPAGGNIVGHCVVNRLWIRRPKWNSPVRIARLTESPWLPTGECVFKITERGVEDKEDEVKPPWTGIRSEPVSNADVEVLQEMVARGYGRGLKSQFSMELDPEVDGVHGTTIDLFWDAPVNHAVFLDGEPVHSGKHQAETDKLVTRALRKRGITVARYRYTPPLTKTERKRIADEIEQALKEKEAERVV